MDADKVYRLTFDSVLPALCARYADPVTKRQNVPSAQIPDEHWHQASRITTDPWDQYRTLRQWAYEESQHVRRVRLEVAVNLEDLRWKEHV